MIGKIKSINEISGFLYRNERMYNIVYDITKNIVGLKGIKLYLDKSDIYPIMNLVLMMDKNSELINVLDNSLIELEKDLKNEFRHREEVLQIYMILKEYK